MFRKLVSNIPYSPVQKGYGSFLRKNLKRDRTKLRLGLVFILLAVFTQVFILLNPSEQARANDKYDIVPGGLNSVRQILIAYDTLPSEKNDFHNLLLYFGITREDITNMASTPVRVCTDDSSIVTFRRQHIFDSSKGEVAYEIPAKNGKTIFYSTPLLLMNTNGARTCYQALEGHTSGGSWFSITMSNGNLLLKRGSLPIPHAHFTSVSCSAIEGYAYDGRYPKKPIKIYLFLGGPPGEGKLYGPISVSEGKENLTGSYHTFHFILPQQTASDSPIWGVLQPLQEWHEPLVQFDNTMAVPKTCDKPSIESVIACENLTNSYIERTKIRLTANAYTSNSKDILGYHYVITDHEGRLIYSKNYNTGESLSETDDVEINKPGEYIASVKVTTYKNEVGSLSCIKRLTIAAPDKCVYNNAIDSKDPQCQPCSYDHTIWAKDDDCVLHVVLSKKVKNLTQARADANNTAANADDRIEYTLNSTNLGNKTVDFSPKEDLSNVMNYATLIDDGGGKFDNNSKIINWKNSALVPQKPDTRRLIVEIGSKLPSTPRASNDPTAYTCSITNSYGNTVNIRIGCPTEKLLEATLEQLPHMDTAMIIAIDSILIAFISYLYLQDRQLYKEATTHKEE